MADPPSTSNVDENYKTILSNRESARFLRRLIQKVDEDKKRLKLSKTGDRVAAFTGLDNRIFIGEAAEYEINDTMEVDRAHIQEQMVYFYLHRKIMPTTRSLFESLLGQIPGYIDIRSFRKHLARLGYIWIKIPRGFVVTERPSVTFERYFYLRDIMKYRQEKREIFYVDETIYATDSGELFDLKEYYSLRRIAAKTGKEILPTCLLKTIYAVSKSGVHALKTINQGGSYQEFTTQLFEEWISNELIPILPPNSVVVLKNEAHHESIAKPTLYSTKSEMMEWLDRSNVPYNELMSKCHFMSLIDTYTTENEYMSKVETMLRVNGHTLLGIPFTVEKLSLAWKVFELLKVNAQDHKKDFYRLGDLGKITSSISPQQMETYDDYIFCLAKETLEIDMKVDAVLDDLISEMTTTYLDEEVDSEIPMSDSD